jgi:hypothetical protein
LDGNFGRVAVARIADEAGGMSARLCKATAFRRGTVVAQQGFVNVSLFQAGAALNANSRWQEVIQIQDEPAHPVLPNASPAPPICTPLAVSLSKIKQVIHERLH